MKDSTIYPIRLGSANIFIITHFAPISSALGGFVMAYRPYWEPMVAMILTLTALYVVAVIIMAYVL